MNLGIGVGAVGLVRIEKWSKHRPKEVLEFPNVVLRSGMETYIDRSMLYQNRGEINPGNSCFLGTGTTQPSLNNTGLEQVNAATGRYQTSVFPFPEFQENDRYYSGAVQFRYDWGEGEAAGTWTELGLAFWDLVGSAPSTRGNANTYSFPFSRALIRDANGTPISLTVLPNEYLRIFYNLISYISYNPEASSVSFDGVPAPVLGVEVANKYKITFSSWNRFLLDGLPLRGANLLVSTGQSGAIKSIESSKIIDVANRQCTFFFSSPPGLNSNYDRVELANAEQLFSSQHAGSLQFRFNPVNKPTVKSISGSVVATVVAKHWEVLLIGRVSSATATTLTMTGANWTPDQFAGMVAGIVAGTGWQSMSTIVSNTADTITVSPNWPVMPAEDSLFEIREYDYVV